MPSLIIMIMSHIGLNVTSVLGFGLMKSQICKNSAFYVFSPDYSLGLKPYMGSACIVKPKGNHTVE